MAATVRGVKVDDGRSGGEQSSGDRSYRVVYQVTTTSKLDGPQIVSDAFGIPRLYDVYSTGNDFDPQAVVTSKDARQLEAPTEWEVEVTYTTDPPADAQAGPGGSPNPDGNPLQEPPVVTYSVVNRRVIANGYYENPSSPPSDKIKDKAILNPCDEPFIPQPEIDHSDPSVNIQKNVPFINPATFLGLANTVNSAPFIGTDARQLKLIAPRAVSAFHKTVGVYWQVSYTLVYRWETWDLQVLNQGSYHFDNATDKNETYVPDRANPTTVNLNADGTLAAKGTWTFSTFRVYREVDFSSLGLI